MDFALATPVGYEANADVIERADELRRLLEQSGIAPAAIATRPKPRECTRTNETTRRRSNGAGCELTTCAPWHNELDASPPKKSAL